MLKSKCQMNVKNPMPTGFAGRAIFPFGFKSILSLWFWASLGIGFFGFCHSWLCVQEVIGSLNGKCQWERIPDNRYNSQTGGMFFLVRLSGNPFSEF